MSDGNAQSEPTNKFRVELARTHSGLNFEAQTLKKVLKRIEAYDADFPGELVSVKIETIS